MNYKKPLLVAGIASGIAFGSISGAGLASAAQTNKADDGQSSIVDKLASKFKLDKKEVKAVFEEQHTQREAAQQTKVEAALTKAVTDGKLTAEQKDKILAKRAEIKADREKNHDSMKDKTDAERKAFRDQKKAELTQWATDNNIPEDYLKYVHGGGHGGQGQHGPRGGHGAPDMEGSETPEAN